MVFFIVWIVMCFIIGSIGAERKIGFMGGFLISLILSPLIGLLVVLFAEKKK